jgi:hypothetical protein
MYDICQWTGNNATVLNSITKTNFASVIKSANHSFIFNEGTYPLYCLKYARPVLNFRTVHSVKSDPWYIPSFATKMHALLVRPVDAICPVQIIFLSSYSPPDTTHKTKHVSPKISTLFGRPLHTKVMRCAFGTGFNYPYGTYQAAAGSLR